MIVLMISLVRSKMMQVTAAAQVEQSDKAPWPLPLRSSISPASDLIRTARWMSHVMPVWRFSTNCDVLYWSNVRQGIFDANANNAGYIFTDLSGVPAAAKAMHMKRIVIHSFREIKDL